MSEPQKPAGYGHDHKGTVTDGAVGGGKPGVAHTVAADKSAGEGKAPTDKTYFIDGHETDIREGEILVCGSTSPAWAPIFSKIRATVTDVGGVMSHAAIVCREYGLPAVVGTGRATSEIRTGQLIRVNGTEGLVTLLDGPEEQ